MAISMHNWSEAAENITVRFIIQKAMDFPVHLLNIMAPHDETKL